MRKYSCRIICLLSGLILFCAGCSEDTVSKPNAADRGNEQDQVCECSTGEHCSASELEDCHRQKPTDGGGQLPDNCPDGDCEHLEQRCPDACPDTCEDDGECPAVVCPESCPGHCDSSGECLIENVCPAECPDSCDEDGICPQETACPAECPDSCDEDGICPQETACPSECPDSCDEEGICPQEDVCPPECLDSCGEDGTCPSIPECPENCQNGCDANGACLCPASCKSTCDLNGVCQCPATCKSTCDADGVCLCPASCKSKCDTNGVCQCPSECPKTCNGNGECPVLCGKETVQSMRFSFNELDILVPGSKGRTSDGEMKVFIKTDKKEYSMDVAPCKEDIQLTCADNGIVKVGKNKTDPSRAMFTAVGVGATTCNVTIKGQPGMKGTIKIHVLNLDKLHNVLNAQNKSKEYIHLHSKPLKLYAAQITSEYHRVSQGFDFYTNSNSEFTYFFSQLLGQDTTKSGHDNIYIFKYESNGNSNPMIFPKSGHGQNLSVEKTNGKDYLWFGSCGTKGNNGYSNSQTIARVEWNNNSQQSLDPSKITEHYYYSGLKGLEPAIDSKNNRFAFRGSDKAGDHVKIYRFSDVKKAGKKEVKIEGVGKISAKDLSGVSILNKFTKKKIAVQGMEIENGIVYAVGDRRAKLKTLDNNYKYVSEIYIYIYDYKGNNIAGSNYFDLSKDEYADKAKYEDKYIYFLGTSTRNKSKQEPKPSTVKCVKADGKCCEGGECKGYFLDNHKLENMLHFEEDGFDYRHNGYLEAEGIRVSDGKLYLSVTVEYNKYKNNKNFGQENRQLIFVYDLAK
ncbi:MAG: hypothetical protein IJM59_03515 [Proteobacteria bacterium]|nr:hypothetical protein [Pseudomonadota bacterium]